MRGLRVLIVDDNATQREILGEHLASWGLTPTFAGDGPSALEALLRACGDNEPFHVALLDRQMPVMSGDQLAHAVRAIPSLQNLKLVMLSSPSEVQFATRQDELRLYGCLNKPVRPSQLLDLMAGVSAGGTKAVEPAAGVLASRQIQQLRGLHVLLAEDNHINQVVASEILRQAGLLCDVVQNGIQAVEAVKTFDYDAVLMDCQMPEMDGFDAARRIRALEVEGRLTAASKRPLPIIALTANAIKGDRERCLEAGMTDHVSKPINPVVLLEKIELHAARRAGEARRRESTNHRSFAKPAFTGCGQNDPLPIDRDALLERCLGSLELMSRLLRSLESELGRDVSRVEEAMAVGDACALADAAHSLKGSAASLSADTLAELAAQLERHARCGDWQADQALPARIRVEFQRCVAALPSIEAPAACLVQHC
jgi:CheY-like chemotaxis protein/HPt (histidine-containing phosphotransfer) domain-containing protein